MVVERSLVAPQPCYSSSASVFHDHERREGKRRRKGWNEDGEGLRMRYFFGLLFRRTGILHGVGRGRDNGIGWPPLLPRNDTLRGYNSPDRPTVSRPILLSGGKGEARTKSDSVLLFFLRFSSSTERSVSSAKRPRRYTYSRNCRSGRNKPFPGTDQSADRTLISRESIDRHIFFFFPSPRKKKRDHEYRERREVVLRKKRGSSSLFRESNLTWRDHEARPDLEKGRRATVCIYIYILYAILLVHFLVRES